MKKLGLLILLLILFTKVHADCTTGIVPVPQVDNISVSLTGNVGICWRPVADPDLSHYVIFMLNPLTGANDSIDFVAAGVNCYTIPAGSNNSDNEPIELGVVAVDVCNNLSAVGANYHNTIWLDYTFDVCTASAFLFWNAYDDFSTGLNVLYEVYISINNGAYSLAGTSLTTDYIFSGITQGDTYDFYVTARDNGGVGFLASNSNDVNVPTSTFLKTPAFNYLHFATVVDSTQIDLQFYVDTAADINSYVIKRAESLTGTFTTIGSVNAFDGMNPLVQFTDDNDVKANITSYIYVVEAVNLCGIEGNTSNIGKTILLKATSDGVAATNTLTITSYEGWSGGVQKYDVYRSVAGIWELSPVASLSAFNGTTVYVDDITSVFHGDGEYCYKIVATENPIAHVGGLIEATSTSNEACVHHEPLLYVPNAFIPGGNYNIEFKPVLTFSDPDSYLFQIYNRWGQKIFETRDVNQAWNGRKNNSGSMSQIGAYVYLIEFLSASGEQYSKRGVVTLLR